MFTSANDGSDLAFSVFHTDFVFLFGIAGLAVSGGSVFVGQRDTDRSQSSSV